VNLPPSCPSVELFERSLESTSRALAGDRDLLINFNATDTNGGDPLASMDLPLEGSPQDRIAAIRGQFDALGIRPRYHDSELHHSMAPAGPLSRAIHDELENLRIEACASLAMTGVAANLAAAFEQRCRIRGLDVLDTDTATPLANAVVLMVRAHLVDKPLPIVASRFIERWRDEIAARVGDQIDNMLAGLCAAFKDQATFARHSRDLIAALELVDEPEKGPRAEPAETSPDGDEGEAGFDEGGGECARGENEGRESIGEDPDSADMVDDSQDNQQAPQGQADIEPEPGHSESVIPFPRDKDRDPAATSRDTPEGLPEESDTADNQALGTSAYHAWTTRYDEVIHARDMLGKEHMIQLHARLERELSNHRRVAVKLANRLQNSLKTLQKKAWTFDLDDGLLNTTRLPRLIIDPASPLAYKQERESRVRDTVVAFLIDNSGSMRGRPITLAAMFTSILAQALERCHVGTEILGFTTRQWRGGQTRQSWLEAGRPGDPGRLSDLRHVIYKQVDDPWRRARASLGAMLWPELLKENIDGEALLWAHRRLTGRPEQRRILVVISDGVPADDATLTANAAGYLDTHLHQVVESIETKSAVEMLAIGIGHDVGTIYKRSVTIADTEHLGDAMAHELVELLGNVPSTARHPFAQKTILPTTTLAG